MYRWHSGTGSPDTNTAFSALCTAITPVTTVTVAVDVSALHCGNKELEVQQSYDNCQCNAAANNGLDSLDIADSIAATVAVATVH